VSRLIRFLTVALIVNCVAFGQTTQSSLTTWEAKYFRYLLRSLGNPDYSPGFRADLEGRVTADFAMTTGETAALDNAVQSYRTFLVSARQAEAAVMVGKSNLTQADGSTLQAIYLQEPATVQSLALQVLGSVRPETAARIKAAANVMSQFKIYGGNPK